MERTHGPWRVEHSRDGYEVWGPCGKTGSMRIAVTGHAKTFDKGNTILIAASPALLEEHEAWSRDFGTALLLALQGDYSAIDELAHSLIIDQDGEGPHLRSAALKYAKGETIA